MKNKNALYIVLGIGAGVVAYYLFCKNKKALTQVQSDDTGETPVESKVVKGGFGGGFSSPIAPKYVTPVATTTPLVVSVTSTTTPTPIATTTATTPIREDVSIVSKPISTSTPTPIATTPIREDVSIVSKPISTSTSTPETKPVVTTEVISPKPLVAIDLNNKTTDLMRVDATQIKSSFQGVGQQCFEVGECLYDL
jgi:hypothetical protein